MLKYGRKTLVILALQISPLAAATGFAIAKAQISKSRYRKLPMEALLGALRVGRANSFGPAICGEVLQ